MAQKFVLGYVNLPPRPGGKEEKIFLSRKTEEQLKDTVLYCKIRISDVGIIFIFT